MFSSLVFADDKMPESRAEAVAMEVKNPLPPIEFYDPPRPLSAAAPGNPIRSEAFGGYILPKGASAVRIRTGIGSLRVAGTITTAGVRTSRPKDH
jgi:hypothetical protein